MQLTLYRLSRSKIICVYDVYVHITTIKEKEAVNLNERAKWGYTNGGGKGKGEKDAIIL